MDVKKLVRMKRNILEKESLEDSDARKVLHTVIVDIHSSKKKTNLPSFIFSSFLRQFCDF